MFVNGYQTHLQLRLRGDTKLPILVLREDQQGIALPVLAPTRLAIITQSHTLVICAQMWHRSTSALQFCC